MLCPSLHPSKQLPVTDQISLQWTLSIMKHLNVFYMRSNWELVCCSVYITKDTEDEHIATEHGTVDLQHEEDICTEHGDQ